MILAAFLVFAALFVVGSATGSFRIAVLGVVGLIFTLGASGVRRTGRQLQAARPGATRVETIKQVWVNQTVQRYADAGWDVVGQSSAKSLGSQARVTITFRKR